MNIIDDLIQQYQYPDKIRSQISGLLRQYPNFYQRVDEYLLDDYSSTTLLNLQGLIPVIHKEIKYDVPISIWLLRNHPKEAPICFVNKTADMQIKSTKSVHYTGRISFEYLNEWSTRKSQLNKLIRQIILVFEKDLPLSQELIMPDVIKEIEEEEEEASVFPKEDELAKCLIGYELYYTTKCEIIQILKEFPTLSFTHEFYDLGNKLIKLSGYIPVDDPWYNQYLEVSFSIPINIWLMKNHPVSAPICTITPQDNMVILESLNINNKGQITVPYLNQWNLRANSLRKLIENVINVFSKSPVFKVQELRKLPTTSIKLFYYKKFDKVLQTKLKIKKNSKVKSPEQTELKNNKIEANLSTKLRISLEANEDQLIITENQESTIKTALEKVSEIKDHLKSIENITQSVNLKKALTLIYGEEMETVQSNLQSDPTIHLLPIDNALQLQLEKNKIKKAKIKGLHTLNELVFLNGLIQNKKIILSYVNEDVFNQVEIFIKHAIKEANQEKLDTLDQLLEIFIPIQGKENMNPNCLNNVYYGNEHFFLFVQFHHIIYDHLMNIYSEAEESFKDLCNDLKSVLNEEQIELTHYNLAKEKLSKKIFTDSFLKIDQCIKKALNELDIMVENQEQKEAKSFIFCSEDIRKQIINTHNNQSFIKVMKSLIFYKYLVRISLKENEVIINYGKIRSLGLN